MELRSPDLDRRQDQERFVTTCWSLILRAGATETGDPATQALEMLCRAYWYPIYAYLRRRDLSPPDAQDLTQGFFQYLLERRLMAKADPQHGHFRSFLLGSLNNFMANQWRSGRAAKRGGGYEIISFDAEAAEDRYRTEPVDVRDPGLLYEQAWAVAVLDEAVNRLAQEFANAGKSLLFDGLAVFLQGDRGPETYAQVGLRLGLSEGAVKVAVLRLRRRCRELLRSVVADTVSNPLEVDEDLRRLQAVLKG
ncbi:MAG TPA: sigma-70 family RNA polymerase sigma factor [Candidatus Limnocylindria bacterium]|jgi:RNA polymerase sigma-70 factor (ECF subfamily)|nr:sigma-70 family RNA polymerase sigma factor [Candidatus Limnocylindria bacterium]